MVRYKYVCSGLTPNEFENARSEKRLVEEVFIIITRGFSKIFITGRYIYMRVHEDAMIVVMMGIHCVSGYIAMTPHPLPT